MDCYTEEQEENGSQLGPHPVCSSRIVPGRCLLIVGKLGPMVSS